MAYNRANNSLTTDFNVTPYYDDYTIDSNYYRILFKPGYAVQARELTQIQSSLQEQINRFGKHVFKEGSIVIPGGFTLETHGGANTGSGIRYVKVKDFDASNNAVTISDFSGYDVIGATSNITAAVVDVVPGTQSSSNTKTLYVKYKTTSSSNNIQKVFTAGETLSANVGGVNKTLVVLNTDPVANVGFGSRFKIDEGVFFAKNHFISFTTQSIILDRYNPNPSCKVGFYVTEDIINASQDTSLLDPALEASNYAAPGADRLKLTPTLMVRAYDDPIGAPDFVELFSIENGVVKSYFERSQYNLIQDEMAKRLYDQSGDYVVRGMDVQIREHDDTGSNFGRYANGNNSLLFVGVSSGLGYVQGYEINNLDTAELQIEKGLATSQFREQIASATLGSYVVANNVVGSWVFDKASPLVLYDTVQRRVANNLWSGGTSPTGKVIGTANVASIEYVSGTQGYDGQYNIYLMDVNMLGSNSFANVRSVYYDGGAADGYGDIVLDSGAAVINDVNNSQLLYYVGDDYVKSVRDIDNPSINATTFYFNKTDSISPIAANGTFNYSIAGAGETFPYGTATLSAAQKDELTLTVDTAANITMTGTVSGSVSALTGVGTYFTRLNVGDKLEFASNTRTYYISAIADDTNLTVVGTLPSLSGVAFFKAYKVGDIIDLAGKGSAAGATRTVSATPTSLTVDLKETFPSTLNATLSYKLARTTAKEVEKLKRENRYVKINCASNIATTSGPFDLGFSDVYKIKSIRLASGSYPTSNTSGTDVTTLFRFDNGQRDNLYDHGTITPTGIGLTSSDRLLVELDYFEPNFTSRAGYFSIDSYPIEDDDGSFNSATDIRTENVGIYKSPVNGKEYNLRNYLDFRPVKTNTATDETNPAGSPTENPTKSFAYQNSANGLRIPVPSSQITYDYTTYMGRKDLLVVDRNKRWQIITGIPSNFPITPEAVPGTMAIAVINVVPYPSLSPAYAASISRPDLATSTKKMSNARFTMRDIGTLKQRIVNLEYYTSLSILEKAASDLLILDDAGLDRFKNGIFTDSFRDQSLAATYNGDHHICVDPDEKVLRPLYTMNSFGYDYVSGTNVTKKDDLVMLNYSEELLWNQSWVTSDRNIERRDWLFVGQVRLFPEQDVWVDVATAPDEEIDLGTWTQNNVLTNQSVLTSTEWNAWRKYVVGYRVYTGTGSNRTQHNYGNLYRTYDEARDVANSLNPAGNGRGVSVETVYNNIRTGTEHWLSDVTTKAESGYKIINTEVIPYIRPQVITVACTSMKPFTRVWTFFDNEPMAAYTRPISNTQYTAITDGVENSPSDDLFIQGGPAEGADLVTDANGVLYFQMRLPPEKKFRCGSRALVVADTLVPVNEASVSPLGASDDLSTGGRAFFFASGTAVTKQKSIYSSRHVDYYDKEIEETYSSNAFEDIAAPPPPPPQGKHCSAYSFLAQAPNGEEGMFLTSVDVFISRIRDRGIWFEIREMSTGGTITRNQVPFSEVWYENVDDIPISTDGKTNALNVQFKAPIFLYHNTMYAFVIHPIDSNPDTYFWTAKLGQTDLNGKGQYNNRRNTGTFFQTNNNINWDIIADVDLTCKFYRANFVVNTQGEAIIGNKPVENLVLSSRSKSLKPRQGDVFTTGSKLVLSSNGTIQTTDILKGVTSLANSSVSAINGSTYSMSNTGYTVGETINVFAANNVYRGISANVTSVSYGRGVLNYYVDGPTTNSAITYSIAQLTNSDGNFSANDYIFSAASPDYNGVVGQIRNYRYSAISFEPGTMTFKDTDLTFDMRSYSNTSVEGSYVSIQPSETYYYDAEQALHSKSNETTSLGGARSNQVRANFLTGKIGVSPVLDMGRTHTIYLDNVISANSGGETASSGGELINRYISKTVTLAEGQDAEDIKVVLTAYRPPNTDVKVWIKILHREDSTLFDDAPWIEMSRTSGDVYSSLAIRSDFKEYTYGFATANLTGPNGEIQYTNGAGITFTGYKYFAIKIGLVNTQNNTAIYPRVGDLRTIALQI
jgi:Domain of unknown function (DUF4815)